MKGAWRLRRVSAFRCDCPAVSRCADPWGCLTALRAPHPLFQSFVFSFHVFGAHPWYHFLCFCVVVSGCIPYALMPVLHQAILGGMRCRTGLAPETFCSFKCIPWTEQSFVVTRGTWLALTRSLERVDDAIMEGHCSWQHAGGLG